MESVNINFEETIKKLSPVTWIYNNDIKKTRQIGYIAEEVNEIDSLRYIVILDNEEKPLALRYDLLSIYSIEVLKTLIQKVESLEKEVKELKSIKKRV